MGVDVHLSKAGKGLEGAGDGDTNSDSDLLREDMVEILVLVLEVKAVK